MLHRPLQQARLYSLVSLGQGAGSPCCHVTTLLCCCRYAGILSAVGIHLADIVQEAQEPTATQLSAESLPELSSRLQGLAASAVEKLRAQGFDEQHIAVENFLNLR